MDFFSSSIQAAAAAVDAATGAVVAIGVLAAFAGPMRIGLLKDPFGDVMRRTRLTLAQWLALALELALAADVLRSVVAPSWGDIGKLAAIAGLRTGLNYFLEKEIERGGMEPRAS
jgi:uncharacterized membrane protein